MIDTIKEIVVIISAYEITFHLIIILVDFIVFKGQAKKLGKID
jgi:hypothetical protein